MKIETNLIIKLAKSYAIPIAIVIIILLSLVLFHLARMISNRNLESGITGYPAISFSKHDRILIIAPHPDDEVLANSSVIIKGREVGATIKVMFVTFGEHNTSTLAKFLFFPSPLTADLLAARRHREAINAAKVLKLSENDLIFLGFPDFGTLKIWDNNFSERTYIAGIDIHDKTFYSGVYKKGVPFTALEELKLFEEVISSYKPTKMFYPSTFDLNPDHRASGLFTEAALYDLKGNIRPEVYTYFVHSESWPEPVGYYPNFFLSPPSYFINFEGNWSSINLSEDEEMLKYKADRAHVSQYWTKPRFMASFVRKNELFLTNYKYKIGLELPLWTREEMQKLKITPFIEGMSVSEANDFFEFNLTLYKGVPVFSKIILFVYPEIKDKSFLDSPKYKVVLTREARKNIKIILIDRGNIIETEKDNISGISNEVIFKIDMSKEHFVDCEGFFCSVYIEEAEHRISETPWWFINL